MLIGVLANATSGSTGIATLFGVLIVAVIGIIVALHRSSRRQEGSR